MATKVMTQPLTWKRFTSNAIDTYVGEPGEPIIDFRGSKPELRICDGVTEGGHFVGGGEALSGVAIPQIISPLDGASNVAQSPIITASQFNGIKADGTADTHAASIFEFASDAGFTNIIHTSGRDTVNLTSYDLAEAGVTFEGGSTVYARLTYEGESTNAATSSVVSFSIIAISEGAVIDGDIVVGQINGYWLLAAPASKRAQKEWGSYGTDTSLPNIGSSGTPDPNSGEYNTDVLVARGSGQHPAAEYCRSMGYDLPNKEELDFMFDNHDMIDSVDPSGGSNTFTSFGSSYIWSSTEYSSGNAWIQRFSDGIQYGNGKGSSNWVAPVRRVSV